MCKSGREIFKGAGLSKMTNTKVIKYGKITENIGYEIVETNSYIDEQRLEHLCILSFVTEKDNQFIYNADECMSGSLQEILKYIAECKSNGLDVYITEYTTDKKLIRQIKDYCKENGFHYYISDSIQLD